MPLKILPDSNRDSAHTEYIKIVNLTELWRVIEVPKIGGWPSLGLVARAFDRTDITTLGVPRPCVLCKGGYGAADSIGSRGLGEILRARSAGTERDGESRPFNINNITVASDVSSN